MKLEKTISLEQMFDPNFEHLHNLCEVLDPDDVRRIGFECKQGYDKDVQSRSDWTVRNAQAMKLALQVKEEKTFPWPRASNVKFPLITVAALQYQARAYPALINNNDLVKAKVWGQDQDGQKTALADRISTHMSWQNLEQDEDWEEDTDVLLLIQAIDGNVFRKRVFDPIKGKQVSKLVLANDFVINYWSKSIETAPRYTEVYTLFQNDIAQRKLDGRFNDIEIGPPTQETNKNEITLAKDQRQGITEQAPDAATPYLTGEQYCWLDLDGDDYAEPYIVTFDIKTGQVWRIVPRFEKSAVKYRDGAVYDIKPIRVYTHYKFIPSPDGGFYALGMGSLLGPINHSVDTALNQSFDATTMKTLGGGFIGRGFKAQGGPIQFAPNQWMPVQTTGDDIRKSIMPLPVGEPPAILFQLLTFLVSYAERIVSATEIQVGENVGQNTPAETARTMDTNGARVYSAIFKRTWRALKREFTLQADLNGLYIKEDRDYEIIAQGRTALIQADDYIQRGITICPAADPNVVSETQALQQAALLVSNSQQMPGHNRYQALLRLYRTMKVPDIDRVLPPPTQPGPDGQPQPANDFPPPVNPKMLEAQAKIAQQKLKETEFQAAAQEKKLRLLIDAQEAQAQIELMHAQVVKTIAEAKATSADPIVKLIFAAIESQEKHRDRLLETAKMIGDMMQNQGGQDGGAGGSQAQPQANAGAAGAGVVRPRGNGSAATVA